MKKPRLYPLFLDLQGQSVLVVGGGQVAERKVRGLLTSGAKIRVVSPKLTPLLHRSVCLSQIRWLPRVFQKRDLGTARLVFAATNQLKTNEHIRELAKQAGIWVNIASPPEGSDFFVPAVLRQAELSIAVSTEGHSPMVAKWIRQTLEKTYGRKFSRVVRFLGKLRKEVRRCIPDEVIRKKILKRIVRSEAPELILQGHKTQAEQIARKIIDPHTNPLHGGSKRPSG